MSTSGLLVISAGMPRAGSGWYYNLMHDLVVASGGSDARLIRRKYLLSWLLTEVNCNLSTLSAARLLPVLLPTLAGKRFVIKTHAGATSLVSWLMRRRKISIAYIFRDPRAALLSAFEYGIKARKQGRANAFAELTTFEEAVKFYKKYISIWDVWNETPGILMARYEDLVENYEREAARLIDFLALDMAASEVKDVVEKYSPEKGSASMRGSHFSHGEAERFRRIFTPEQLGLINQEFSEALERMGYKL